MHCNVQRRALLLLTAAAFPDVWAATTPRSIGLLFTSPPPTNGDNYLLETKTTLAQLGWKEGVDVQFRAAYFESAEQFEAAARALIEAKPDILVAQGNLAILALRRAGSASTPIVFTAVTDPVERGVVRNLARPEGLLTGFTSFDVGIATKWLQLLRELYPQLGTVVAIGGPVSDVQTGAAQLLGAPAQHQAVRDAAGRIGVATTYIPATPSLGAELGRLRSLPAVGLIVLPAGETLANRAVILRLATEGKFPAVYWAPTFARRGGLVSYGPDFADQSRKAAGYVHRLLKGERVIDLPVQSPTKFELILNRKAAEQIGLRLPESLLVSATEVLE